VNHLPFHFGVYVCIFYYAWILYVWLKFPPAPVKVSTSSMALVVMSGQPCSGKSKAAACLTAALRSSSADLTVRVIDESSLHLGRNDGYKGTDCYCLDYALHQCY
jgi:protein KTI12